MSEQLRLEGTEVPSVPNPMTLAARWLGLTEVQRCRERLAEKSQIKG